MKFVNTKFLYLVLLVLPLISFSQSKPTIYVLPGQGSDKRLFDSIHFDTLTYHVSFIEYSMPEKGMSMREFAHVISKQIDTTQPVILLGVSLGGMICCELCEFIPIEKVIIISSAKNRAELPFRYRFQKIIPLYKIMPPKILHFGAKCLQPIVEPDRNTNKETFKKMLYAKNPKYIKRTIHMIITWDRDFNTHKIIHIHGTNDHTLPLKNIQADYIILKGSHMMCLTRGTQINKLVLSELSKK